MPVLSPGRDPLVSQAWAFSPGGRAASPGACQHTCPVCRPCPSPLEGAMETATACARGSWMAGARSALPTCPLPCHGGLAPRPEVLLSVTAKTFNKQCQYQVRSHSCLDGHCHNLRSPSCHSWDSMSSPNHLGDGLLQMAGLDTADREAGLW